MIFKQVQEIIDGTKTQTRRIVKPGENTNWDAALDGGRILEVYIGDRLKWQVGRDYAVQDGRGRPGLRWFPETSRWGSPADALFLEWTPFLRIVITGIRRERLQAITPEDARDEGIELPIDCAQFNGAAPLSVELYRDLWDSINTRAGARWENNPPVWVIDFEVKK